MLVPLIVGALLLVWGVVLLLNERRAAVRRSRPVRRWYVVSCVVVALLGLLVAVLQLPALLGG